MQREPQGPRGFEDRTTFNVFDRSAFTATNSFPLKLLNSTVQGTETISYVASPLHEIKVVSDSGVYTQFGTDVDGTRARRCPCEIARPHALPVCAGAAVHSASSLTCTSWSPCACAPMAVAPQSGPRRAACAAARASTFWALRSTPPLTHSTGSCLNWTTSARRREGLSGRIRRNDHLAMAAQSEPLPHADLNLCKFHTISHLLTSSSALCVAQRVQLPVLCML